VIFDRAGVDWIVNYAQELKRGEWPEGVSSDYPPSVNRTRSARAYFENPCLVIAELEIRVKRCGLDGFLVEEKISGKDEEQIARERFLSVDYVRRRVNKVLWYCSSGRVARWISTKKRKGLTYEEWLKGWHWRKRK
jgi:hypothetical protein